MDKRQTEALVVLLDVGADAETSSLLRSAASALLQARWRTSPLATERYGYIAFGCDEPDNSLHTLLGGYDCVRVQCPLAGSSIEMLKTVQTSTPETGLRDYLDAIVVAVDILLPACKGKRIQPRVVLFTDGSGCITHEEQVSEVASGMAQNGVRLDAVLTKWTALSQFEDEKELDDVQISKEAAARAAADDVDESTARAQTILARICRAGGGKVQSLQQAVEEYETPLPRQRRSAAKFNGTLDITEQLKIPIRIFARTMEAKAPSAGRLALPSTERLGRDVRAVIDRKHYSTEDDSELGSEDLIKGHAYGPSIVPVNQIDECVLSLAAPRCLSVLCFADADKHTPELFLSPLDVVIPHLEDCNAVAAFSALTKALREQRRVAIARFVPRADTAPWLAVLWADRKLSAMYLSRLPTAEDFRHYQFKSLCETHKSLSAEQIAAAEAFVDRRSCSEEKVQPWRFVNPWLHRLQQAVEDRALHGDDAPLPPLDPYLTRILALEREYSDREAAEELRRRFELTKVQAHTRHRKYWSFSGEVTTVRLDPYLPGNATEDSKNVPREVGEVTPVEDFQAMLACKSEDLFDSACESMFRVALNFISSSVSGDRFGRATDALDALRRGIAMEDENPRFNEVLEDLIVRARRDERGVRQYLLLIETDARVASVLRPLLDSSMDAGKVMAKIELAQRKMLRAGRGEPDEFGAAQYGGLLAGDSDRSSRATQAAATQDGDLGRLVNDIV